MARIRVTAPTEPFPIRGVIIWPLPYDIVLYPYLASWQLCTGAGGSPDYRDHHIRGAINDAAVGTVIGADTHTHTETATAAAAGAHTHTIDAVANHTHGIVEDCHNHSIEEDTHNHSVTVPASSDYVDVCSCNGDVSVSRDWHLHGTFNTENDTHDHTGTTGNDSHDHSGSTGLGGGHTHTESQEPNHTHVITVTDTAANNIPLTRLCHFIQYLG